jgi:hypothetical protein
VASRRTLIDTDDHGEFDYWLSLENRENGEYLPVLSDYVQTYFFDGNEFPGTGGLVGTRIVWQIAADALDSTKRLRIQVWTQKSDFDAVRAEDFIPDAAEGGATANRAWITVE